jgi:hypothetical protein
MGTAFVAARGRMDFDNGTDTEEPKSDDAEGALTNFAVSMTIPNESLFGVGWASTPRLGDLGPLTEVFVPIRSADFDRSRTVFGRAGGVGGGSGGVGGGLEALDG